MGAGAMALERKGIKTEKGNYNREVRKYNHLVKVAKEQLKNISSWIDRYVTKLHQVYGNYKEESRREVEKEPLLFNLREYLDVYDLIQKEKSKNLKNYAKQNKQIYDLKKFVSATYYLKDNTLETLTELQGHIESLRDENYKINGDMKKKNEKIRELETCLSCAKTIQKYSKLFEKYKKTSNLFYAKDNFYKAHEKEIKQYQNAFRRIEKITGSKNISMKDWSIEKTNLIKEMEHLNARKESIKEKYQSINHIKYTVEIVNQELGIDLSVIIDQAIKRGEKKSIIEQIKKYKEEEENYKTYKQKTKEEKINTENTER